MSEINTYLLDCMKLMKDKPDKHYQLAIVDPPYARNGNMNGGGAMGEIQRSAHVRFGQQYRARQGILE